MTHLSCDGCGRPIEGDRWYLVKCTYHGAGHGRTLDGLMDAHVCWTCKQTLARFFLEGRQRARALRLATYPVTESEPAPEPTPAMSPAASPALARG